MSGCKWTEGGYLEADGEPCEVPRNGHCTARRTCAQHVAWGEQTCGRCVGRTRMDLRQIVQRAALMLPEALEAGVNSEAANLAGPTTDPEAWSWRKVAAKQGVAWHVSLDEDDDETDAERVLTVWAQMLSEDYRLPRPDKWDLSNAAAFLERILHRIAQDEEQDFPLMARELRRVRSHLESVMSDSQQPERGVPCPICADEKVYVRLGREYPHWCADTDCHQFHVATDEADLWVCPRNREHAWTHADYSNRLEERKGA